MKYSRRKKRQRKIKEVKTEIKKCNDDKKYETSKTYVTIPTEDNNLSIGNHSCTHLLAKDKNSSSVAEWCATRRCAITICTMAVILVTLVILAVWLAKLLEPTIPGVKIIPRIEWGAQPPERPADPLTVKPPPYVIISHTATMFCYTQAQCVLIVRTAQTLHIESKGWDDIGYNFLVGGDGNVYQGRGWGVEGAHTFNYNRKSIGISFIGTFNSVEPTKAQLHAAKKLIEEGVEAGEISKDYKLLGHRQCTKTESPGEVLYNIIKTWDHWSPTP